MNSNSILIFTDGSSKGNPGPGGFGAIIVHDKNVTELGGREDHTTNNRMELNAAIESLFFLEDSQLKANNLKLFTDSSYLINGITKWIFSWQKKGWISSQREKVMNRDLWEKLYEVTQGKNIEWKYVAGHSGHSANERCDEIATSFADNVPAKLYNGPLPGYKVDVSEENKSIGPKTKGKKAYSYVSLVDDVIQTHATWDECKARVSGKSGAKYKKAISSEDERLIVQGFLLKR